jgi:hypothetical protein
MASLGYPNRKVAHPEPLAHTGTRVGMVELIEKKVPGRKTGHSFLLNSSTNFGSFGAG